MARRAGSWRNRICMDCWAPKSSGSNVRSPAPRRKMRSRSWSTRRRPIEWFPQEMPAAYLPLCVCAPAPAGEPVSGINLFSATAYRISLFGFLGPNRRLPVLLRALANFAERDRFRLDIYGTIEGAEKIQQLIGRLGLGELVTMHGFVRQDELDEALRRTDLVVNLRNPSMGEASASQLHLWQYGASGARQPAAWYETLPADTVAFVRPEHEARRYPGASGRIPGRPREISRARPEWSAVM